MPTKSNQTLSFSQIVEGSYYAIQQAGYLLYDAVLLYQNKKWASSLVLGVLSFEELGKADILKKAAQEAEKNGAKSVVELRHTLRNHKAKLEAGRRLSRGVDPQFCWVSDGDPQQYEKLSQGLTNASRVNEKVFPRETHEIRMLASYVDVADNGTWVRPVQRVADPARVVTVLETVRVEYRQRLDEYRQPQGILKALNSPVLRCLPDAPTEFV